MSAQLQTIEPKTTTALQVVTAAIAEMNAVAAGLNDLKAKYADVVYDMTKPADMERARQDRLAIRKPRYAVEAIRKGAKSPIVALGREVDGEAARITEEILAIENPIHEQITNEENRKEAERLAKIEAARKRQEDINNHIDYIRGLPLKGAGRTSAHALKVLEEAETFEIGDEFAEFAEVARTALVSAVAALKGIVTERQAHEAEQERIIAEREELKRLRAEQRLREIAERAVIAEEERVSREERAAEAKEQENLLRSQREEQERVARQKQIELDRQARETEGRLAEESRLRQVDLDRIEKERNDAWDLQQAELQRERAEIERQKDEMARANAPIVLETPKPTDEAILSLIAGNWGVDEETAVEWVLAMDFSRWSIAA
jgi:hypothetical protein